ncbi:MAG: two-component regulator propeller domain-containing protein [Eubacteriales bacterium]|nr:two-component regulator propeller domain-containing protein [Eubacteriales bacterium]
MRTEKTMNRDRGLLLGTLLVLTLALLFAALSGLTCFAESGMSVNASGIPNRTPSIDPTGRHEGYSAVLYNNTNGLPTSEANAITETDEGFIWIGSYSGLVRYDGNTFERMDSSLGISSVMCLYVDSRGRMWIGTNDSGVFLMEPGELRKWDKTNGLKAVNIRAITEDANGTVYIATTAGIAMIDSEMHVGTMEDPRLSDAYVRDLRMGCDGVIYGLTQLGDLFTVRDGKLLSFLSAEDCRVSGIIGIFPDPEKPGCLYLGTESAEVFYGDLESNFASLKTMSIAPLAYVESFECIDGQIWICAGNGIGNLDHGEFRMVENVPMNNSVGHVMTDYEGNLWFTSTRQGVMKIVPNQFTDVFEACDLSPTVVNSACMYDRQLFVATDSGLLVIEDGKALETLPLTKAATASGDDLGAADLLELLDGVRIRSIIRDGAGRLWISTWRRHGLLRYDRGEVTAFTPADGLFSDRVRVVYECGDGSILVANTGGVNVIEGDRVAASYGEEAGIVNTEILTVTEGWEHELVLGSDGGGIYIIGADGTRHIGTEDGLSSEVIMRIRRDDVRKVFWIVTSNSLAWMADDWQVHTVRDFPYSNNYDVYLNSQGDLWILSSNGIYVTPADALLAGGEISPVYYGLSNGLPGIATANSYSELTDEGELYIASSTGIVRVNIDKPFEHVDDLKAAVPFVDADGIRFFPDKDGSFHIPADTHKLTVYSYVYTYSLTNPQVSYHLEGFDKTVTTVSRTELMPVDYTNLRGGAYDFVMTLADSMGRGSKETSVRIFKAKAYYEQAGFYLLAGLAALLVAAMLIRVYVRRRMQKLEKKNQETMTFVREITEAFAKVIDMKDKYTNGHSTRVAKYTTMLAKELGYDDETIEKYYRIALLHDIGKVGVPPEVLNKPGKLTDEEFETIKSHTVQGYDVLRDISIMPELAIGAEAHHERPDGKGYPNRLKGDEIPRVAQIIAVADCFDAMYSNRPYRNRMNFDKVVSIIKGASGTQPTPDVVDAFLRLVDRGEFRAPDDHGGGSMENIENIHKRQESEQPKEG